MAKPGAFWLPEKFYFCRSNFFPLLTLLAVLLPGLFMMVNGHFLRGVPCFIS